MVTRSTAGSPAKDAAKKTAAKPKASAKAPVAAKATAAKTALKAKPAKRSSAKPKAAASDGAKVAVRLKDLIDRVVATLGVKKKDAKPVIEATLKHLGDALEAGEAMILQPLGRIRVNKAKGTASGDMLTVKLKRPGAGKPAGKPAQQGLAADGE